MSTQPTAHNFEELELVAEKAGELNDRVGKIESELGAQTKTLESAALVLDAAIKGLGALKSSVLENDIGALQLELNDKTAHLAREIGRFESAVAEIDRRAESGDDEIKAALLSTAHALRAQFDAKSLDISEWSARVEKEIAAHSVALAAIPPVIKGADAVGFNPVGEWETGKAFARMDVVSYAGSSYISNVDGNTEKPSKSKKYTVLAKRAGSIGSGGVGGFAELTGTILPAQLVPGQSTYAVGDVLYASTTGALSKLGAGTSGQLLSTQGAGAAPIWVTATGGAGDMNGPASATDNAIVRFDGTGGKTAQNSAVTISDLGVLATVGASSGITVAGTTASTSPTTGSLINAGGFGNAGALYNGGAGIFGTGNNTTEITPTSLGRVIIKKEASADAYIELAGNGNTAGASSLVIGQSGADLGVIYNRKNAGLSFGTNGTERFSISAAGTPTFTGALAIGNTVNSVSPTSPNRTITMVVGGVTLYIAAKTTND